MRFRRLSLQNKVELSTSSLRVKYQSSRGCERACCTRKGRDPNSAEKDIIPNRASGYQLVARQLKNQDWVSPTFNSTGDGTLYFNVLDLAKWDEALYGTSVLKQSSLDRIWTVFPLNNGQPNRADYGFGWGISMANGHKVIQHGGAWQGFTCFFKMSSVVAPPSPANPSQDGCFHYLQGKASAIASNMMVSAR